MDRGWGGGLGEEEFVYFKYTGLFYTICGSSRTSNLMDLVHSKLVVAQSYKSSAPCTNKCVVGSQMLYQFYQTQVESVGISGLSITVPEVSVQRVLQVSVILCKVRYF